MARAARQVESCSEINEAASNVESEAHMFFMNREVGKPIPLETRSNVGKALQEHFRTTSRHSLFLTREQSKAAEELRGTSIEMAALIFAIVDNPAGVVPPDVPEQLRVNIVDAQSKFRTACETAFAP